MLDLTKPEHQQLVFLSGSRTNWRIYMGLNEPDGDKLWNKLGLQAPVEYIRAQTQSWLHKILAEHGSYQKAADHYGVSASFLKSRFATDRTDTPTNEMIVGAVKRFKSIAFAARMLNARPNYKKLSPAAIRKACVAAGEDPALLVDYAFSNHEAGKGRRAELDFLAIREKQEIQADDMNLIEGSQAEYDVLDQKLGRVNVKSSRAHRFKARSRGKQRFWKFSAHGKENCDVLICMCYEDDKLIAWTERFPDQVGMNSFTILESELLNKDVHARWVTNLSKLPTP